MSPRRSSDRVTLTCSVTPKQCDHEVKWLNNNEEVKENHPELTLSLPGCEFSVSFRDPSPPSPFYKTLKCEVRQKQTDRLFILNPEPPPDDKTTAPSTPSGVSSRSGTSVRSSPTSPKPTNHRRSTALDKEQTNPQTETYLLKIIVPVVVILLLVVAFVVLMLWKRRKGSGDRSKDTVKAEDGVTYASVQIKQKNTNDSKKPRSREEENVTYSSVNVSGQTQSRKTVDPEDGVTYASVNFEDNKKKKKKQDVDGVEEENVTYSSVAVSADLKKV